MKKRSIVRVLMMVLTMLIFVFALTACGGPKNPTEDDVRDALEDAGYIVEEDKDEDEDEDEEDAEISKDSDKTKYEVKIDKVKLNDDKDKAKVDATLVATTGKVKATTTFKITFKYKESSKKWKAKEVEVDDETEYKLSGAPSEDEVSELLKSNSLYGDTASYYSSDFTGVKEAGEGKVEDLTYTGTYEATYEGFSISTVTVELTMEYYADYGWYINDYEITDVASEVSDEYAFDIAEGDVIAYYEDNYSSWYTTFLGSYSSDDEIVVSDVEIDDVEVTDTSLYDVPLSFTVTFNGKNSVTYDATMTCYYDEDDGWYISSIYTDTVSSYSMDCVGTWSGTVDKYGTTATVEITDELNDYGYPIANVKVHCSSEDSYSYEVGDYEWEAYVYGYETSSETTSLSVSFSKMISCPEGGDYDYRSFYGNITSDGWVIDTYDNLTLKKSE